MAIDPVSGNEIPAGGTAEGVRDDIPAMIDGEQPAALSEGEFVIPKHVVDFYGPETFEAMMASADAKLEGAPTEGGVEEAEFSDEEMIDFEDSAARELGFALGGLVYSPTSRGVKTYAEGGLVEYDSVTPISPFSREDWGFLGSSLFGDDGNIDRNQVTVKTYVNEDGKTISVTMVNGEPIDYIPDGFNPIGEGAKEQAERQVEETVEERSEQRQDRRDQEPDAYMKDQIAKENEYSSFGGKNPFEFSQEELLEAAQKASKRGGIAGKVGLAGMKIHPIAGLGAAAFKGMQISQVNALAQVAEAQGFTDVAEEIRGYSEKIGGDGGVWDVVADGSGRFGKWQQDFTAKSSTEAGGGGITSNETSATTSVPGGSSSSRDTTSAGEEMRSSGLETPEDSTPQEVERSFGESSPTSVSTPVDTMTGTSTGVGRTESDPDLGFGGTASEPADPGDFGYDMGSPVDDEDEDEGLSFSKGGLVKKR